MIQHSKRSLWTLLVVVGVALGVTADRLYGGEEAAAEGAAGAAEKPAMVWNTLPDRTWLLVSFPDTEHARKAFAGGKLHALGQLPGIRDFVADVQKFYQGNLEKAVDGGNLRPYLKTLNLDLKTLLDTPQGEATFAIVSVHAEAQQFDLVLKLGLAKAEQATGVNDLVDTILAMRPDLPVQKRTVKYGAREAYTVEIPEANLGAFYATADKCLLIGTQSERFGQMVQKQPAALEKETALKDSALVKALEKALKGTPDFVVYVNLADLPQNEIEDQGLVRFLQGAEKLGVRKVAYALRFDDASGNVLESFLVDYNPEIWKAEAALTRAVDLSKFERGAGGTIAQATVNVNWAQAWNVLYGFMRQGPNAEQGERMVKGLEAFFETKIPTLLAALDGQVTANVALPRTETGFVANVIPDMSLQLGLADAAALEASMGKLHEWVAQNAEARDVMTPEKITVEGARAAWQYTNSRRHNPFKPVLAIDETVLTITPMMPMLTHVRRATPYGPQLAERTDWQKLKPAVHADAFLVAYLDLATAAELGYNFGTSAAAMARTDPFAKYNLPQGDAVGKVFTGWLIQAHAADQVLVVQSQSSVGIAPGIVVTALAAQYFEVSEKTERLLARRDMAAKRLAALYDSCSKFNQAAKKLPAKLSELYPDHLKNIADFTVGDQAWSMNPAGNGERLRALIDDRTEFVMLAGNFGAEKKPFLLPKQSSLDADQGMPVVDGAGQVRMLSADEYAALLEQTPEAAGTPGAGGGRHGRGGWRGRGGDKPQEPPPLPPAENNPDEGF